MEGEAKMAGKIFIGIVERDLHDIGKNPVTMMLEGDGFEIVCIGTNVAPGNIIENV